MNNLALANKKPPLGRSHVIIICVKIKTAIRAVNLGDKTPVGVVYGSGRNGINLSQI